ncbi:MAG: EAL domain-containing protein [Deltaproteobacteria bacterium]
MGGDGDKILLVDDEPLIRVLVARQLSRLGFTPVVAATAEEALALSQTERFRVVITDLQMSGMGGIALLQRLSPIQPQARFLVLTGRGPVAEDLLPRGHRIRVFSKPWDENELAAAVRGTDCGARSTLPPPPSSRDLPTSRVLLIESDSSEVLDFCGELAAQHPGEFATTVASDIPTAYALLDRQTFDVIAYDLELPGAVGLQAIARLQGEAPQTGVVVFTAVDDPELAVQTLQAGAQDCLIKGQISDVGRALRHAQERKRAERRLASIAFHDPLTGLANRSLFRQHVAQAAAFAKRSHGSFAVLVLDLDRFKFINDSLGHDAGDAFLQEVAHRLQVAVRDTDTVARLGGDEFAVLATPMMAPEDIGPLSERILAELRRPIELSGTRIEPTASIGAAIFPDSGRDSDTLLSAADAAMYVVKEAGRNGVHVHGVELKRRVAHRLKLEEQVREAVALKQFRLHYQPQVSLAQPFLGSEALLRWAPENGPLVAAREFVQILEDTGLIIDLGSWVIETACQQLGQWRRAGHWVDRMAINICSRQVISRDFVALLRKATQQAGLECCDIELDLTESMLLRDKDNVDEVLRQLAADGYRLALDNFGTGCCSLAYLQKLPITTLKLDRCFVEHVATDGRSRSLVGGIIHLAKRIGLDVVAEGVETQEQLQALRAEDCSLLQGHLFAPPMPPEEFASHAQRVALDASEDPPFSQLVSRRPAWARTSVTSQRRAGEG